MSPSALIPGSSKPGEAVMAVVGTALAAPPPAPPKVGSRGAEKRDDVDSRDAREPGRSGEFEWAGLCGRPGTAAVAGTDCTGDDDTRNGKGDGVRVGEGSEIGACGTGSGGAGSAVAGA